MVTLLLLRDDGTQSSISDFYPDIMGVVEILDAIHPLHLRLITAVKVVDNNGNYSIHI